MRQFLNLQIYFIPAAKRVFIVLTQARKIIISS